jgi:AcrR family transcriptional regulator
MWNKTPGSVLNCSFAFTIMSNRAGRCLWLTLSEMSHKNQPGPLAAEATSSPRRKPVQSRSHQTVTRILDAASSLLAHMPLDDITTTRIAAAAGLSIGALYRFFPDKQPIIDALAVRHIHQFGSLLQLAVIPVVESQFAHPATFDPAIILNRVIDAHIAYLLEHPDFRAISFGRHISSATREREASPDTGLPALLTNFMLELVVIPNTPELDLKLRIISEAGDRLIAQRYQARRRT